MNYYALIPLVAFFINVFTWTYTFAQKRRSPVNSAYLALAAMLAAWTLELFFLWLPVHDNWIPPLLKLTMITGFIVGFAFLNFTYIFLEKAKDKVYYTFLALLIISSAVNVLTDLYITGYTKYYWGLSLQGGPLFVPIAVSVVALPIIYSLSLLYNNIQKSHDMDKRKQLLLLFQGTLLSLIIGLTSDVFIPYIIGIKSILRIGISGTILQSIFVFWAVSKHNFLSIDTKEIANDLFVNVTDGVILINNNEYILQMNSAALRMFDMSKSSIKDARISSLLPNYKFEEPYKNYETSITVNGSEKVISLSQASVKQSALELGKILILRDITENKRAEQELRESKSTLEKLAKELAQANASLEQKVAERTRSLLRAKEELDAEKEQLAVTLSSIGDGVITTDTAGHVVLVNKAAEQLTGWSQLEAAGQQLTTVFPLVDEKTREPCEDPVQEAMHTDTIVSRPRHSLLRARDHTERIVAESAAPIHAGDGDIIGVVLVFRDMTDRRRIEEELIRADKFESIGVLAGGIAHDFNNILTAILGNVSLAKMYANPEDKVFSRLMNAEKATLQAQNLTQQLLTFSKGETLVRRTTSIVDLIKDSIDFSMRGSNVRCELSVEPGIWPVDIDAGRISQVINNLLINAYQAMPDGGIIDVQVENVERTDDGIDPFFPLKAGEYVSISVKDHGIGIPEENLQKIFDPYFTTKQKGTGLGLFTCYSIIKKHDGHIAVESCQGVGTTFHVYIPASRQRVFQAKNTPAVQPAGTGRILMMEDEEIIRDVTGEMLSHYGYEVAFAKDGTEAIALYRHAREAGTPFDVIIMDLTIPGGMGGKEAVKKILALDPHAKAVVASGYANDPIVVEYRQYGFCDRIAKPYKSEELHAILHRIMQRR